jgi:hypothetical protein
MKNNNFTQFGLACFSGKESSIARNERQYALSVFRQLIGY